MPSSPEIANTVFFDPFTEDNNWDPEEAFEGIFEHYRSGSVLHDYTADMFVANTEVIMLGAQFTANFAAISSIAARMHQLCGEDHALQSAMQSSSVFGARHADNDGHDHSVEHDSDSSSLGTKSSGQKIAAKRTIYKETSGKRLVSIDIIDLLKAWRIMPKRP